MINITRLIFAVFLMIPLFLRAQDTASVFTLEEAIDYALENSFTIQQANLAVQDADAQVSERLSVGLPQLSASGRYQYYFELPQQPLPEGFASNPVQEILLNDLGQQGLITNNALNALNNIPAAPSTVSFVQPHNFTAGLNLESLIFDNSYFVAVRAARAFKAYTQQELLSKQREIKDATVDAYLPVLIVDVNLDILQKNIANLEKLRFETQELYSAGFAEQLDVDRLGLSLVNLKTEEENLVRQRDILLNVLKYTINYPVQFPLEVEDDIESLLTPIENEELVGKVLYERRPEVGLLDKAIELNELNIRRNKSAYLPSLSGFGGYQYQYFGNNLSDGNWANTGYVGLSLSVPIFDGLNKKALIERAQIDLEEVRLQREEFINTINLQVGNARIAYQAAKEKLEAQEQNKELAQRIYDTTLIKYREGVGSSVEVSQAEQELYASQQNYLQALYDLLSAQVTLRQALGTFQ